MVDGNRGREEVGEGAGSDCGYWTGTGGLTGGGDGGWGLTVTGARVGTGTGCEGLDGIGKG